MNFLNQDPQAGCLRYSTWQHGHRARDRVE